MNDYLKLTVILLIGFTLGYYFRPAPEPCMTLTHIGTDSFGERYTVQGGSWSGYMVTDRPVWIRGECGVEVVR